MKTVLILGGRGFIGSKLAQEMAKDHKVIVADVNDQPDTTGGKLPEFGEENQPSLTYVSFDFLKGEGYPALLRGVDAVFHLVATNIPEDGTRELAIEVEDNLLASVRLFDAMLKAGVNRLFFISSGGTVYGETDKEKVTEEDRTQPICKYGLCKVMVENTLELYRVMHGLDYRVIRYSNPYGTKARTGQKQGLIPILVDKIEKDQVFTMWGDGENIRDYLHIEDAVIAARLVYQYDGPERVFNVGSGKGYSVNQVVAMVEKMIGCQYNKLEYQPARLCDVKKNVLDITKIKQATGWEPKISLNEGLEKLICRPEG